MGRVRSALIAASIAVCACAAQREAPEPKRALPVREPSLAVAVAAAAETSLGVADRGIFEDVSDRLQIRAPARARSSVLLVDDERRLLVLYADGWPRKVYPLGGPATLAVGTEQLRVRDGDRAELAALVGPATTIRRLREGESAPPGDHDRDGIPDPLDVLIGAHKAALNGDHYDDRYFSLAYPSGDPPRQSGACVDVIVRAVRNAGLDLQSAVFEDLRAAPALYGKAKPDPNIDHRRVRTVLVYLKRHWQSRSAALDDPRDPLRVGDVVLLDTFPHRPGPDHIGVVSELAGESGHPLVINNWTFGYTTRPMDLLGSIPVTHRFRFPSRSKPAG